MESFLRRTLEGKTDEESHRYFIRFGKGQYRRRFLLTLVKGKSIKMKTSFELANDLVVFAKELGVKSFSGKVFTKEKASGIEGKKKAGVFVYEVENSSLDEFSNIYYALVDCNSEGVILKMKKALPKPGKDAEKIDDSFCSIEIDPRHLNALKEVFLWDVPECKKAVIEHELNISGIVLPTNEKDPVKIRELARRKGNIVRKIVADGKEIKNEHSVEA